MDIYSKRPQHRIDHPSRDPNHARAVLKGQEKLRKLKFESEGQKRDYERAIRGSDFNVPGLPPFFPAKKVGGAVRWPKASAEEMARSYFYWRVKEKKHTPVTLWCAVHSCDRLTLHYISDEDCYCTACGSQKPYRSVSHN